MWLLNLTPQIWDKSYFFEKFNENLLQKYYIKRWKHQPYKHSWPVDNDNSTGAETSARYFTVSTKNMHFQRHVSELFLTKAFIMVYGHLCARVIHILGENLVKLSHFDLTFSEHLDESADNVRIIRFRGDLPSRLIL